MYLSYCIWWIGLLIKFLNYYSSNCFLTHHCKVSRLSTTCTFLHLGKFTFSSFNSCLNTVLFRPFRWTSSASGKSVHSFRLIRWTVGDFYTILQSQEYLFLLNLLDVGDEIHWYYGIGHQIMIPFQCQGRSYWLCISWM